MPQAARRPPGSAGRSRGGDSLLPPARFPANIDCPDFDGTNIPRNCAHPLPPLSSEIEMIWIWIGFIAFVLLMLALDLGVFHRKAHVVTVKEALGWSAVWIALGLASPSSSTSATRTTGWAWAASVDAGGRPDQRRPLGHRQVPHRLRRREIPQRRQHLRHRHDLRLLRRARHLPAPRAVLGHPRRPGHARRR